MTNSLFIGIDVSLQSNQICVLNFDQHKFFNLKFSNTPDGCEEAINKIKFIYDKFYFDKIVIVCEATGMYSFHLACYFSSHEYLNNFNTEVYQINAHDFAKYKDSFSDVEKTDPSDAYILADFARVGRTKALHPFRGSQYIALQRLTRQRYHISKNLVKEKLYVMNNIYLSFSGLIIADKKNRPFSNMFGATSCAIFDNFDSPDQIAETPVDDLLDLISKVGKNRTKNPIEKINLLNKAIRSSYRLDQTAYNGINIAVASSLSIIRFLESELKQVDKAILAGYNNTHFDTDFLRQWFIDNNNNYFGSYFWSNSIDVMPEASRYFVHYRPALLNFKLGTVAKALGIETDKSSLHDGLYDIKLTLLMFKKLLNEPYIKPFINKSTTVNMTLKNIHLKRINNF